MTKEVKLQACQTMVEYRDTYNIILADTKRLWKDGEYSWPRKTADISFEHKIYLTIFAKDYVDAKNQALSQYPGYNIIKIDKL